MTLRLVALMSVVLLLSLAAFGLLMSQHQERVMQEVARTASDVGRATLRTFELRRVDPAGDASVQRPMVWLEGTESEQREAEAANDKVEKRIVHRVFLRHGPETDGLHDVEHVIVANDPAEAARELEKLRRQMPGLSQMELAAKVVIDIEDVRAEQDPARGEIVLKIPKLLPADVSLPRSGDPPPGTFVASREEIRLPISVEDYRRLFSALRGRSLFLFLGVFVVGSVLSAGLASRFTRPVRLLDAGLRRLSEGDLDVQVEVRGKDEIARLSRAFNDMAARLRANRERAREMVRREKLSALGRLAAGVAHDVRNPLHSIGLTLQHLSETSRPADRAAAAEFDRGLELIRSEIRRLDRLVGNFLRFAKSERQERAPVDLAELLRETARLVGKEAEWRGVRIELDLEDGAPPVLADGEALRSSILNLVLNGFEAMPDGGTLTLGLGVSGDEVRLDVADTGRGIPDEDRERVFEFAYTTRADGSGLGLAMVHHCVVEEHGGRVTLESQPGVGTRVRLALPARLAAAREGAA